MFARALPIVISSIALFSSALVSSTALAQCGMPRYLPRVQLARQITPIIDMPREGSGSSLPTLNDLARQATSHTDARYQSCESHRAANPQWAAKQSPSSKQSARAAATPKYWTDEERAASKYHAAHSLWQAGKPDAARRWLEVVLRDYSKTPTAERARVVLAKL